MTVVFEPGQTIHRREVLHGRVWLHCPVTVVADDGEELAVLVEPGAPFSFPEHPFGPHPWRHLDGWSRTQVLQLYRPELLYAVWMIFERGEFESWYLNFEAPLVRRPEAIDTLDHGLDLLIGTDGTTAWKDVEDLAQLVRSGRLTETELLSLLEAAEQVSRQLAAQDRWWSGWERWRPPSRGDRDSR